MMYQINGNEKQLLADQFKSKTHIARYHTFTWKHGNVIIKDKEKCFFDKAIHLAWFGICHNNILPRWLPF